MIEDYEIEHEFSNIGCSKHIVCYVSKDDFRMSQYRNHCGLHGLLAEDVHLKTSEVCANLCQTCSMSGLISTAMRSRIWEDRYWLD